MSLELNIPANKLPAAVQARRVILAAQTGRPGPVADAICSADKVTSESGLPTYTETREAIAALLELVDLLADNCTDRVDVSQDDRVACARRIVSA